MINKMKIVIQKDDSKSFEWGQAGKEFGFEFTAQTGSAIKAPLFLFKFIINNGLPTAYIIRYLNDYPSLFKTLLRTFSEFLLIVICRILRINVFWICHNVDRETLNYHSKISKFRRWLISGTAIKIFVTDKFLIPYAIKIMPDQAHKIDSISFGKITEELNNFNLNINQLNNFLEEKKNEALKKGILPLCTLVAGTPVKGKCLHFENLVNMINKADCIGFYIIAIVAGRFKENEYCFSLIDKFKKSDNIYLYTDYTIFPHSLIKDNVDFYYRGYSDFSVPYTIYEAATLQKPVMAINCGFLPELVLKYKLGSVLEMDFSNLQAAIEEMLRVPADNYKRFLMNNSWDSLSGALVELKRHKSKQNKNF